MGTNPSRIIIAAMGAMGAMLANAIQGGTRYQQGVRTLRGMGLVADSNGVHAAKNGGRKPGHGNRAQLRASIKLRNQRRHKKACR